MQFDINHPRTIYVDGKTYNIRSRGERLIVAMNNSRNNPIEAIGYNLTELEESIRDQEEAKEEKRQAERQKRQAKAAKLADAPEATVQALWRPRVAAGYKRKEKMNHVEQVTVRGWDQSAVKQMKLLITTATGEKLSVEPNAVLALDADTDRLFALEAEGEEVNDHLEALESTAKQAIQNLLRVPCLIDYDSSNDRWFTLFGDRRIEGEKISEVQNKVLAAAVAETLPWAIDNYTEDKLIRTEDLERVFEYTKAWARKEDAEEYIRLQARQKAIWKETRRIERFFNFDEAVAAQNA